MRHMHEPALVMLREHGMATLLSFAEFHSLHLQWAIFDSEILNPIRVGLEHGNP
jgi:hypothetical protein